MTEMTASTAQIRQFSGELAAAGRDVAAAGKVDIGASVAVLGPVFGLIGADFVTVYGAARTAHATSVERLAGVLQASGEAAGAIAGEYDAHQDDQVVELRAAAGLTL